MWLTKRYDSVKNRVIRFKKSASKKRKTANSLVFFQQVTGNDEVQSFFNRKLYSLFPPECDTGWRERKSNVFVS